MMHSAFSKLLPALFALVLLPFVGWSQFNLQGQGFATSCECYVLTTATNNQTSTVWNQLALDLSQPFDFSYEVFLGCTDGGGADGMAWALHTNPNVLGAGAGKMGMGNLVPSFGVFMDGFNNGASSNDPPQDHITIHRDGDVDHLTANNLAGPVTVPNFEDCMDHTLRLTWNPTTQIFIVFWDGAQLITYNVDLINTIFGGTSTVYWGLGAGTGGLNNEHRFCVTHDGDFSISDTTVCLGVPVTTADNSTPWGNIVSQEWIWGDGTTDNIATPTHTYSADTSTTVSYVMTDQTGCPDTTTVSMVVASPTLSVSATDSSICPGDSTQLMATAGGNFTFDYAWSPAASLNDTTIANPTASPLDTVMYVVTATDQTVAGCTVTDSLEIVVLPAPTVDLGPDSAVCAGDSVALDASNPGSNFLWQDGSMGQQLTALTSGTYTVSVTTPALSTCTVEDSVLVTIVPYPTVDLGADTLLCNAASLPLDAGNPGANFLWSDSTTLQTLQVTDSGSYWVTASAPLNAACNASDTIHVTVIPAPTVNLGPDSAICVGDSVVLDAGNAGSVFIWQDGSMNQQLTALTTGTYTVSVTTPSLSTCTVEDSVLVTVVPYPIVDLGADTLLCDAASLPLDAGNAGANFLWNDSTSMQTLQVIDSGSYWVTVSAPLNAACNASDTIVVTVVPAPTVSLGPDSSICTGDSVVLDAGNAGSVFIWQDGSVSQQLTALTSGTYTVSVTSPLLSTCTVEDSVVVTVVNYPIVDLGPDTLFCELGSLLLDAGNPGANFLWNDSTSTQTLQTADSGSYWVTVSAALNAACSASDTVELTVVPLPVVDLGTDTTFCQGDSLLLDAQNAGSNYLWQDSSIAQVVTAATAGDYSVTVTSSLLNTCQASDTITVATIAYPILNLPGNLLICDGDSVAIGTSSAGVSLLWNTGSTADSIVIDSTGSYWVTAADSVLPACATTDTTALVVVPFPVVDLGPDTLICDGDSVLLNAANAGAQFLWQDNSNNQTLLAGGNATYSVTVSSAALSNCAASDDIQVISVAIPLVDLGPDPIICDGDSVVLNADNHNSVFTWSTGWWGRLETVLEAGVYTVTVASPILTDCAASDSVELIVQALPEIFLGGNVTVCPGTELELDAGADGDEYVWHDGSLDQYFLVADSGLYHVTVTDFMGCENSDSIEISLGCPFEFTIPNVVTPNADGQNDVFTITGQGIESFEVSIYNRWGTLINEASLIAPWDGRDFSGNAVVAGTYFYAARIVPTDGSKEEVTKQGTVAVLR